MIRRTAVFIVIASLFVLTAMASPTIVRAHQPYCEFADLTVASPWETPDAAVSYAYYGNLYPASDVDYFTFDAAAGQSVLLSLSIPAIDGQEDFAPVMAVFGPGIDSETPLTLPARVDAPSGETGMFVPLGDEPVYWYEPFGGRYYWNWEDYFFEAPDDATYTVALWHPEEELGRYTFVIGQEEIFGGEQDCMASFDTFWTPLIAGENPYRDTPEADATHMHADGAIHKHGEPLDLSADTAPVVDLQVMPLGDGGYNVRVQTLNFIFAPQHVGMEPVAGEGHAHLYVDGDKVARIYGEWHHLETLPDDAKMVSVGLFANNHQPLAVDGTEITDMVMIADLTASE